VTAWAIAGLAGLAAGAAEAQTIYFADIYPGAASVIRKVNVDGSGLADVLDTIDGALLGLDVDPAAGKIYYCEGVNGRIRRVNLDGTGDGPFLDGLQYPSVVRVNPAGAYVVFGDQTGEEVGRADYVDPLHIPITSTLFHRGLVVDGAAGFLYWDTDVTESAGRIIRSNLDGTNQTTLITGVGKPAAVALDAAGGKLYWTDYVTNTVRRANFDGSGLQTLYTDFAAQHPRGIALDLAAGKLYWGQDIDGEPTTGAIIRTNLDGTGFEYFQTGLRLVNDMVLVNGAPPPPPCYANCDGSTQPPVANVADFTCFLQKFASAHPYANCDASTTPPTINVADFTCFLQKFAAGCP